MERIYLAGMTPVAFQAMTLANSTALAVNSTVRTAATTLVFSVETNSVRMRADSTAPTLTTGVLYTAGAYTWQGFNGSATFRFQRSTGTAKVSIMGFRQTKAR